MRIHEAFLARNLLQTLLFSLYTFDIHLARADFETTNGSQQKVRILKSHFPGKVPTSQHCKKPRLSHFRLPNSHKILVFSLKFNEAGEEENVKIQHLNFRMGSRVYCRVFLPVRRTPGIRMICWQDYELPEMP